LLVALRDFWLGAKVLALAVLVQQIIENLIAPRVLGSVTGLSPVWVFMSILAGARIGGLLGVVVAVPTAVVLKSALLLLRSPQGSPMLLPNEARIDLTPGDDPPAAAVRTGAVISDEG
jgi:predicted PurR-regulated permease PerM